MADVRFSVVAVTLEALKYRVMEFCMETHGPIQKLRAFS